MMVSGAWHCCWQQPLRELFQVSPRARGTPVLSVQAAVGAYWGTGTKDRTVSGYDPSHPNMSHPKAKTWKCNVASTMVFRKQRRR